MKKESAAWYIAATHYLTAGFAIPLLLRLAVVFGLVGLGLTEASFFTMLIGGATWLVGIWFGVQYSASYLKKKYLVTDASKVVTLATIYLATLQFIVAVIPSVVSLLSPTSIVGLTDFLVTLLVFISSVALFYAASKKFVHQDTI